MKDKRPGDGLHSWIELETEARLVALILGESSDFEEDELARLMEKWPEVRAVKGRFAAVDEVVREAVAPGRELEWKLSPELRVKLLEAFDLVGKVRNVSLLEPPVVAKPEVVSQPVRVKRRKWLLWLRKRQVAFACLAMLLFLLVVVSPTIFERDGFDGSDYERAGLVQPQLTGDLPDWGAMLSNEEAPREFDSTGEVSPRSERQGVKAQLAALGARLESSTVVSGQEWHGAFRAPVVVAERDDRPDRMSLGDMDPAAIELLPGDIVDVPQKNWLGNGGGGGVGGGVKSPPARVRSEPLMEYPTEFNPPNIGLPAHYGEDREELPTLEGSGVGAKHPELLQRRTAVAGLEEDLDESVASLRETLESELDLVDGRLEEMRQVVSQRRDQAVDMALESQDYIEARREYENAQGMLQSMKLQHSSKRIALKVPKSAIKSERDLRGEKQVLGALDAELRDQADVVEEKRKALHTIVSSVGIPYFEDLRGSGQMGRSEEEVFRTAQRQQYEIDREKRQLEIQLKTLSRLSGEELAKYAAGLKLPAAVAPSARKEGRLRRAFLDSGAELAAAERPFSTFSLHVSDVSFKLAQAALEKGEWPEGERIRVEEFVNAFDYGDRVPTQRERVRCVVEQAAHPFLQQRNLVRVSMRTAALGRAAGTPLRLTVLLDHSGSMEREDRAESVRRAFVLLAEQLGPQDQVTLISFARTPRLLADRVSGDEAASLLDLVETTRIEGGTNLEAALELGMEKAMEQRLEGGQNRVILLTDGAANLGNARPDDLSSVVTNLREAGIAFDACGVGADGLNDDILESLTRRGDGRYYFLDRPEDADEGFAKQIAGALRPAAKNVKVQVHFNPKRVGRYKLFGFEKHKLKKEDFRNDSVDAAELAGEEAGNAVYQVEVLPEGEGEIGRVAVRFQDAATGRMVERVWVIPHDPDAPRLKESARSMRLAGSAALFGEWLKGSATGEAVAMNELGRIVGGLRADYAGTVRVQELAAMTEMARGMRPRGLE